MKEKPAPMLNESQEKAMKDRAFDLLKKNKPELSDQEARDQVEKIYANKIRNNPEALNDVHNKIQEKNRNEKVVGAMFVIALAVVAALLVLNIDNLDLKVDFDGEFKDMSEDQKTQIGLAAAGGAAIIVAAGATYTLTKKHEELNKTISQGMGLPPKEKASRTRE